jgi:hypothetical protein
MLCVPAQWYLRVYCSQCNLDGSVVEAELKAANANKAMQALEDSTTPTADCMFSNA